MEVTIAALIEKVAKITEGSMFNLYIGDDEIRFDYLDVRFRVDRDIHVEIVKDGGLHCGAESRFLAKLLRVTL